MRSIRLRCAGYVLLLNPNVGIEKLHREGKLQTTLYGRFRDRLIDIGAQNDISDYDEHLAKIEKAKTSASAKAAKTSKATVATASKSTKSDKTVTKPTSRPPKTGKED